jgi:hypothetical protein
MRQTLLLAVLLLLTLWEAKAQKIRITDNSNVWQVYNVGGGTVYDAYANIILFSYGGDTVLGGNSYKIMVDSSWGWYYTGYGFPIRFSGTGGSFIANWFIREDTLTNQVFIWLDGATSEILLYDYNLQVGDTFHNDKATYIISSLDSVLINTIPHKRWHYNMVTGSSTTSQYDVVEGIGSSTTPQNPNTFENGWNLLCFTSASITQSSLPIISVSGCSMDSLLTVEDIENLTDKSITISPNPVTLQSKVSFPYKIARGQFIIADMCGRVVMTKSLEQQEELQLLTTYAPGLYTVQVKDFRSHRTFFSKMIVR